MYLYRGEKLFIGHSWELKVGGKKNKKKAEYSKYFSPPNRIFYLHALEQP